MLLNPFECYHCSVSQMTNNTKAGKRKRITTSEKNIMKLKKLKPQKYGVQCRLSEHLPSGVQGPN